MIAEGTPTRPIIFTSRLNLEGQSGPDSTAQWGGIVLLGRAPINNCIGGGTGGTVTCEAIVEGPTAARYGGASATDTSGSLRYIQVRYAGFEVSLGNELNGITLGGVGTAQGFDHIQVHNNEDDGIEWFGGLTNGRYLIVTGAKDDSLDTDFGYKGLNQFVLVVQRSGDGDKSIEADTAGNDTRSPRSNPMFVNMTIVHRRPQPAIQQRGGTDFRIFNSIVRNEAAGRACVQLSNAATIAAGGTLPDKVGPPVYRSTFFSCEGGPAQAGTDISVQQIVDILTGNNNVLNGVSTLQNVFFPGANELAVPTTPVSGISGFLVNTTYIGAFRDSNDRWFDGWSCGLGGAGSPACETPPIPRA
jgi:hypothetical protein